LPPKIVALFTCAHFAHHLVPASIVPLLPFIRDEFALDYTMAALVVSAFSVPYGFSQMPAGWVADRLGPARVFLVGIVGTAALGLVVGLSTTYVLLLASLVAMGILGGGYHPAASSAIGLRIEPERRASAYGLHTVGGGASQFVAPVVAAAIAASWGWRSGFMGLAAIAGLIGILVYTAICRTDRTLTITPPRTQQAAVRDRTAASDSRTNWRRLVVFIVFTGFTASTTKSVVSFVPLYLIDVHGFDESEAATAISIFYSCGLWASILGGFLADRLGRLRVVAGVVLLSSPVVVLLGMASSGLVAVVLVLLLGIAMYVRSPASESYIVEHTPSSRRSTVLGLYYFWSFEGSGIVAPFVGLTIDSLGFSLAFTLMGCILVVVGAVCALALFRRFPHEAL